MYPGGLCTHAYSCFLSLHGPRSSKPANAGPVKRLFTAWQDAQLARNNACPSCEKDERENKTEIKKKLENVVVLIVAIRLCLNISRVDWCDVGNVPTRQKYDRMVTIHISLKIFFNHVSR